MRIYYWTSHDVTRQLTESIANVGRSSARVAVAERSLTEFVLSVILAGQRSRPSGGGVRSSHIRSSGIAEVSGITGPVTGGVTAIVKTRVAGPGPLGGGASHQHGENLVKSS